MQRSTHLLALQDKPQRYALLLIDTATYQSAVAASTFSLSLPSVYGASLQTDIISRFTSFLFQLMPTFLPLCHKEKDH